MLLGTLWNDIFLGQAWGRYPGEELIRFVARNFYSIENRASVKILELGCGPGPNLWYFCREGFSFVGVDISSAAIEQASQRLSSESPGWESRGRLLVCDAASLPIPDASIHAVVDNECVYCNSFDIAAEIYKEAYRVLRPGGMLFVRTFADGSWGDKTGIQLKDGRWVCSAGALANKGPARFTKKEEIPILLKQFHVSSVELISRSCGDLQSEIREWIICAEKLK